jgi:hypothetical protein
MSWEVVFADAFECEFDALPVAVQISGASQWQRHSMMYLRG